MVALAEQSADVEMKNADSPTGEGDAGDAKKDGDVVSIQDIREHARQIEKAVQNKEPRFILRVLRSLPNTRRKLNSVVLRGIITGFYTHSATEKDALLNFVEEPMETEGSTSQRMRSGKSSTAPLLPEVDAYIHLLVLLKLIDGRKYEDAVTCSDLLMQKVTAQNRRTLDLVTAKCYFYHSRSYELTNQLEKIRGFLHSRLRTATLRNDYEGQGVLINCLLRNYLHYNLYDQADKLVSKSVFPESASNNEWARFFYYLGRIKAARLEYSAAHKNLVQALRKAPQNAAVGFRQTVQKLAVTVELLLGDIPERQIFRHAALRRSLAPYFQLTQAVRMGNLQRFGEVLENFGPQFRADHTFTLILRLRHNVIKTAIRSVGLSYSRIAPADIAKKLGLDSPEDAEFIVAKAIRDGVIEATLDRERGYMRSKETTDIYCTREPQLAFHQRISFCLELHNQSVKAMRYPPKSYGKDLESAEERREREQQDMELAKEMAEEDDDGFP
ncbi:probable 26S proteasome non-ATPase regulatory subunit 3 [Schistocerca cancellata]|uniref:probable 26S proteasome non-ATPase regulatory subunit 3 n=1 Tax=Schistocerca cancellata TaxID=274614 RepID=UPI0021186407|nr:probable 26S proteasome non-ATPase regulatory subunit 3 [Schistocerca cancellata]XP_049773597.1 probable 26S proteasome non-ATPase regulatory subunit 3 [Schistocerca cancellata]XP_049773598.1 probable 26S proteasome non-ATPase regulatory subunit 3 [Schistocerca cancellata]